MLLPRREVSGGAFEAALLEPPDRLCCCAVRTGVPPPHPLIDCPGPCRASPDRPERPRLSPPRPAGEDEREQLACIMEVGALRFAAVGDPKAWGLHAPVAPITPCCWGGAGGAAGTSPCTGSVAVPERGQLGPAPRPCAHVTSWRHVSPMPASSARHRCWARRRPPSWPQRPGPLHSSTPPAVRAGRGGAAERRVQELQRLQVPGHVRTRRQKRVTTGSS